MKVKCTIIVEVDEKKLKLLGYDNSDDYLNDCTFSVYDDESDNIITEVREYEEI